MRINKFTRKHAVAFLDYGLFDRKIGARTYNNYIERMKAILNELVDREYLEVNPFSKMKKKKMFCLGLAANQILINVVDIIPIILDIKIYWKSCLRRV